MQREVTSYRLPEMTLNQIDALADKLGMSKANVISHAVDRMYQVESQATHKLLKSIEYSETGEVATVTFEDGTTEERHADANGVIVLADLYFRDARTGQIARWGEDGAYEFSDGFARL